MTMSASVPRIIVLVCLCAALVSAQTFQYSRGWTAGGRKRSGMMLVGRPLSAEHLRSGQRASALAAAAALLEDAGLLYPATPCQHVQASPGGSTPLSVDSLKSIKAVFETKGGETPQVYSYRVHPHTGDDYSNTHELEDQPSERRRRAAAGATVSPPLSVVSSAV